MKKINQINVAFLMGRLSNQGGISRVTSMISNEFQSEFKNVHVISYHRKENSDYDWNAEIKYFDLLSNRPPMSKGIFKASARLRKYIFAHQLDIIIICGHNVGPLAILATRFSSVKLIYWSHNSFTAKMARFKRINERINSAFSDVVVSLTKYDQKSYKERTLAREVDQIYNPVANELLKINSLYNPDTKKIISIGRLSYQKNFETLVEVAKIVFTKHQDYVWHIYGSGALEDEINKKIRHYGLEEKVILMGQVGNIYELYPDYSILVMTSRFEGFPMSLLEGMASSLPLISFDVPTGPNEIIREMENGFLIPPFDVKLMAESISKLITDRNLRISFAKRNKDFIAEFDIKNIKEKWLSLIIRTCNKN